MARRMAARSEDDLALDDKLDIASTFVTLRKRIEKRHELNEVHAAIKTQHAREVNSGRVSTPVLPNGEGILKLFGANALPAGEDSNTPNGDAGIA